MATIIGDVPTAAVIAAFEADIVAVKRWVDIYEADNVTLWRSQVAVEEGEVSVDFSRAERRNFSCKLNDGDNNLGYGPTGFWYDKILKPYRGVKLPDYTEPAYIRLPGVIGNHAVLTRTAPGAPTTVEFAVRVTFDAIGVAQNLASWANADTAFTIDAANKLSIRAVNTSAAIIGNALSSIAVPFLAIGTKVWLRGKVTASSAVCNYWYSYDETSDYEAVTWVALGTNPTGTNAGTTVRVTNAATIYFGTTSAGTAGFKGKLHAGAEALSNAKTLEFDPGGIATGVTSFGAVTGQTVTIASTGTIPAAIVGPVFTEGDTWVTCLGEFMVDTIQRSDFPKSMDVGCRDFVKKLMLDKFTVTTGFAVGTVVATAIRAIATNAGITKFNFAAPTDTVLAQINFDRGSPRWDAIQKLAESISHEIFFDNFGVLTLRPYVDPLTAPLAYSFKTGVDGNLISFSQKTNDTQMFNHVIVYGDGPENPLVYAEVENTNPTSPTRIAKVGRRTWTYASQFIATNGAALVRADAFLGILGLESYDISLESITLPWLEGGDAIEAILPNAVAGEPTRFLLTSFSIPLELGGMSASAKRVSIVG